jgi:hypothetical protein
MGDALDSVPEDFPPGIQRYPYKGRDDFLAIWDYESCLPDQREFLVTNISKDVFDSVFLYNDEKPFRNSWKEYIIASQLLVFEMAAPQPLHEKPGALLGLGLVNKANGMGNGSLANQLIPLGGTAVLLGRRYKRPDASFRPGYLPNRQYPTVVFETALTESPLKLRRDAHRWVVDSEGQTTAITIRVDREREQMVLRRWVLANGQPVMRNSTTIDHVRGRLRSSNPTAVMTGAPFVIPYQEVYGREPRNASDRDVSWSKRDLERFSLTVWAL